MRTPRDIVCKNCSKLIAKEHGTHIEVVHGNAKVRIYEAVVVAIDCPRCGLTTDLPVAQQKAPAGG